MCIMMREQVNSVKGHKAAATFVEYYNHITTTFSNFLQNFRRFQCMC